MTLTDNPVGVHLQAGPANVAFDTCVGDFLATGGLTLLKVWVVMAHGQAQNFQALASVPNAVINVTLGIPQVGHRKPLTASRIAF